jgi:predicted nucleotidyltransferase
MRKPLSPEWQRIIADWAAEWQRIEAAYVFGSRAKGWSDRWMRPPTPESDLDVAVIIDDTVETGFTYFMFEKPGMLAALEPHFPCPVDLQLIDAANTIVTLDLVRRTGKRVYQRDD